MSNNLRPVILAQFGPPSLACIRSWGRQGLKVGMICIHNPGEPIPRSRFLVDHILLPHDKLYTQDGITIVSQFLETFQADGLTCINERTACWLQDNRHTFPSKSKLWLPPEQIILNALSKELQIQAAIEAGLNVLPTYLIDSSDFDINSIRPEHFPLCLRPCGLIQPTFKVKIAASMKAMLSFLRRIDLNNGKIIAQPFLNMPNLVVHGARAIDGRHLNIQTFIVERKFQGVTLTIKPYTVESCILNKCSEMVSSLDIIGPYHFEFLFDLDAKKNWFLEINNRLGGTTAKVLSCGYDEPLLTLTAYGAAPKPEFKLANATASNKMALIKCFLKGMQNKLTPLDFPQESKTSRLCKTLIAMAIYRDDVIDQKDIKGSLSLYWNNISGMLKRH